MIEPGELYLVTDDEGTLRLYQISAACVPRELDPASSPQHGRGSLGHGYTYDCDETPDQCNNGQCRSNLTHDRCVLACSSESYWDYTLAPWVIQEDRRKSLTNALRMASMTRPFLFVGGPWDGQTTQQAKASSGWHHCMPSDGTGPTVWAPAHFWPDQHRYRPTRQIDGWTEVMEWSPATGEEIAHARRISDERIREKAYEDWVDDQASAPEGGE